MSMRFRAAYLVSAMLCHVGMETASGQNLLTNGGFEVPAIGDGPTDIHVLLQSAPTNSGGWIVESGNIQLTSHFRWKVEEGLQAVDLNGNTPGTIYQDVPTRPGHEYAVSFFMAGDVSAGPAVKTLRLWWGDTNNLLQVGTYTYDGTGQTLANLQWTNYVTNLIASTSLSRIRFESTTDLKWGPGLDDVSVTDLGLASGVSLAMVLDTGHIFLQIDGRVGHSCQIDYREALDSGQWNLLTNVDLTTNSHVSIDLGPPTNANAFFRAIQSP